MRVSRWTVLQAVILIAAVPLFGAACDDDPFAPENVGSFAVDLVLLSGTPGQGSFLLSYETLGDVPDEGTMPIEVDDPLAANKFTQVPVGRARVELSELPNNCTSEDTTRIVNVVNEETQLVVFTVSCE